MWFGHKHLNIEYIVQAIEASPYLFSSCHQQGQKEKSADMFPTPAAYSAFQLKNLLKSF